MTNEPISASAKMAHEYVSFPRKKKRWTSQFTPDGTTCQVCGSDWDIRRHNTGEITNRRTEYGNFVGDIPMWLRRDESCFQEYYGEYCSVDYFCLTHGLAKRFSR